MNEAELVRDGLLRAFLLAVPLVAAVTAGAVIFGAALARLGVRDALASTVIRALAVVVTLIVVGEQLAGDVVSYARGVWAEHLAAPKGSSTSGP
ncbi:MAG: hypothetical protein R3B09_14875 [Nannocystaceae bacterium]